MKTIFEQLDKAIEAENLERSESGAPRVEKALVRVMGQMALFIDPIASTSLRLAVTGDVDALIWAVTGGHALKANPIARQILEKNILPKYQLTLDSDSSQIWIPENPRYKSFINLSNVKAEFLDPESILVSKAIKAKEKNKSLVLEALASEKFEKLGGRIVEEGGDLEYFLGE